MLPEQGKLLKIGDRVVHKPSGCTGEVRVIIEYWGVEVWVPEHNNNKERWWWDSITVRMPRKIKRYPRPFRFARLQPTKCCHCQVGRMVVVGEKQDKVRCTKCKFLVGSESFPHRIERARGLLRRAAIARTKGKGPRRKKVARPKNRKVTHPRKAQHPKLRRKKNKGRVGVRPRRRKEERHVEKSTQAISPVAVPTSPAVPTPENPPEAPAQEVKVPPCPHTDLPCGPTAFGFRTCDCDQCKACPKA